MGPQTPGADVNQKGLSVMAHTHLLQSNRTKPLLNQTSDALFCTVCGGQPAISRSSLQQMLQEREEPSPPFACAAPALGQQMGRLKTGWVWSTPFLQGGPSAWHRSAVTEPKFAPKVSSCLPLLLIQQSDPVPSNWHFSWLRRKQRVQ